MKIKCKIIIGIIIGIVVLLTTFVTISLLSVRIADIDSLKVTSFEKNNKKLKMAVGVGTSYEFLVGYNYKMDGNNIYITVKKTPFRGIFFGKSGQIEIDVPLEDGTDVQIYLQDKTDSRKVEAKD